MSKSVFILAFIIATRFFGLFIILPVFSGEALNLNGANEFLLGLTIGIYAIAQMIFQTPFGALSDKIGRKITIFLGLVIFIIGSLICAVASDIFVMLFGRFIQGCGAVGAVATAMIADLTNEQNRSKAMAVIGAMIGLSFIISLVIAAPICSKFGLAGLFYLSAFLSVICALLLLVLPKETAKLKTRKIKFALLFSRSNLLILNLANLVQKMFMSIMFFIIPLYFARNTNLANLNQIYEICGVFGLICMAIAGMFGDKKGKALLILSFVLFYFSFLSFGESLIYVSIVVFFIAFCLNEPILQSLASKKAPVRFRGEMLGIFTSFGYLGSFLGGLIAGIFALNLLIICALICVVLLFLLKKLR
nr:MFS transporter [Campylobacter sp.]